MARLPTCPLLSAFALLTASRFLAAAAAAGGRLLATAVVRGSSTVAAGARTGRAPRGHGRHRRVGDRDRPPRRERRPLEAGRARSDGEPRVQRALLVRAVRRQVYRAVHDAGRHHGALGSRPIQRAPRCLLQEGAGLSFCSIAPTNWWLTLACMFSSEFRRPLSCGHTDTAPQASKIQLCHSAALLAARVAS